MNTTTLAITLKAFKHIKSMSRETLCFTATVCLDGKPIGHAENHGHGGCTFIHLNDYGRSLPAVVAADSLKEFDAGSLKSLVDKEADAWVNAAEETRLRKRVAKDLSTTVLFTRKGDKEGAFRTLKARFKTLEETKAHAAAFAKSDATVDKVLNLLPFDEAFNLLVKIS